MIKALKNKYALSDQGAKDLLKGIIYSVLANISLMFPVILLAIVLNQLLAPVLGTNAPEISAIVYTVIGIVILAVVFIFHYCQYTATYLGTYDESARRRIGLAEKLRTLPLTFFHQRDLADLTSTIMGDCANFEHAFSHTVPQFFGAVISTGIVCIGLLIFNWQMGLALLWVAPISFAIVILSRKCQEKLCKKHMNTRLELAEGIQECLETVQTGYNLSSRNLIWDAGRVGLVVSHNGVNDGDHLPASVAHGRHVGLPFIPFFLEIKLQRRIVKYRR